MSRSAIVSTDSNFEGTLGLQRIVGLSTDSIVFELDSICMSVGAIDLRFYKSGAHPCRRTVGAPDSHRLINEN